MVEEAFGTKKKSIRKALACSKFTLPKSQKNPNVPWSNGLLEALRAKEDSLIIATGSAHPHQRQNSFLGNTHMRLFTASEGLLLKSLCSL